MSGKTLYDKIWDAHVVSTDANGESVLYIDLHLIHEVTTPQAFAGLKARTGPCAVPTAPSPLPTTMCRVPNTPTINSTKLSGVIARIDSSNRRVTRRSTPCALSARNFSRHRVRRGGAPSPRWA